MTSRGGGGHPGVCQNLVCKKIQKNRSKKTGAEKKKSEIVKRHAAVADATRGTRHPGVGDRLNLGQVNK